MDITLDDQITTPRAKEVIMLAIHIVGRPVTKDEPIPRKDLIPIDKLITEGSTEEQKIDLG